MTNNSKIIDWQSLEPEKFGQNMVDAIRNLNSDDPEVRMEALTDLFHISWHQGTLWWESAFVTPFLRQFIPHGTEEEKEWILFDLAHFATGSSYHDAHQEIDKVMHPGRVDKPEYRARMAEELKWVCDTHEEVYKGVNLYLDLLEDDSPKVRSAAAYVLSCCLKDAETIIPKLQQRFHCESDEMVKVTIVLCLTFISKKTSVNAAFFEKIINSKNSDFVKLSAAVSLAYVTGEQMSDNALEDLVKLLEIPELFNRLSEYCYGRIADIHHWILVDFLVRLREEHKAKIIPVLLQVSWDFNEIISFPFQCPKIPEKTTFENLTESQQFVLRAIVDRQETWRYPRPNQMLTEILGIKGSSPREQRQKLIDFLSGEPLKYDR